MVMLKGLEALVEELCIGGDYVLPQGLTPKLALDNSAAVSLGAGTVSGDYRNRHLKLKATAITECLERGELSLEWLTGEQQVADLGTKSLSAQVIKRLRSMTNQFFAEELRERQQKKRRGLLSNSTGINQLLQKISIFLFPQQVAGAKGGLVLKEDFAMNLQLDAKKLLKSVNWTAVVMLMIMGFTSTLLIKICMWNECSCRKEQKVIEEVDLENTFVCENSKVYHNSTDCAAFKKATQYQTRRLCTFCKKLQPPKEEKGN